MKKDLVIVRSKTVNNESVPVVYYLRKKFGGIKETREISRSYVFTKFRAKMLLRHALALVKSNPKEFQILKPASKRFSKKVAQALKIVMEEKVSEIVCKICRKDGFKSNAGLIGHIRFKHPEKFQEMYPSKPKKKSKKKTKK